MGHGLSDVGYVLLLFLLESASAAFDTKALDCGMRREMHAQAISLQPWRGPHQRDVFDSLQLQQLCGDTPPPTDTRQAPSFPISNDSAVIWVASSLPARAQVLPPTGEMNAPFLNIADALAKARSLHVPHRTIVLQAGTHFLSNTLLLGPADNGLVIQNAPREQVWISGGLMINASTTAWTPVSSQPGVWSADLSSLGLEDVPGLFATQAGTRFTRARHPNGNVETNQWGYASEGRLNVSLPATVVSEWTRPSPNGTSPTFEVMDLAVPSTNRPIKNNSAMDAYNTYTVGTGGVCDSVWRHEPSYWCSNGSAGGWAEVDQQAAVSGQLGLPVGFRYNGTYVEQYNCSFMDQHTSCTTDPLGPVLARVVNASGGIVHAWHSQSWAVHMFEIESLAVGPSGGSVSFLRGGWQGGRNWCRCDQCSYAGPFCRQHQTPPDNTDDRLISGNLYMENIRELLDAEGEFYYNQSTSTLFFAPNGTLTDLTAPVLQTLIRISGDQGSMARNITLQGVGFRDAAATFMSPEWAAPSGGDWALYRGGAVMIENAEEVTVRQNHFSRVDGNALFLASHTRAVLIERNEFSWIGDGAMATWGDTDGFDATGGAQPRGTIVRGNFIHEIGLYEKQSSGWGQAKACLSTIEGNIMFNMPRAAINFNDGLGGGNEVRNNLIYNTCRESGDHGPINSWDRMPFLTTVSDPKGSFDPKVNRITQNLIVANYGGSQGVDNDDGSSFYEISDNVFYAAEGFKMDYGGHDSTFTGNLVVTFPYDGSNCINLGGFLPGHANSFANNTCVLGVSPWALPSGCGSPACADVNRAVPDMESVGSVSGCNRSAGAPLTAPLLQSNSYYTPKGNATLRCGGTVLSIGDVKQREHNEGGSSWGALPTAGSILTRAREMLAQWN